MNFDRIVTFRPAFDRRDPDPSKNYGIHGVELRMVLRGERGATQFLLYTNWHLPHVTEELWRDRPLDVLRHVVSPMPADLGHHWPTPTNEYEAEHGPRDCDILPGGKCFYDGSGLAAERVYERLLREGDAGVWAELEGYYRTLEAETAL